MHPEDSNEFWEAPSARMKVLHCVFPLLTVWTELCRAVLFFSFFLSWLKPEVASWQRRPQSDEIRGDYSVRMRNSWDSAQSVYLFVWKRQGEQFYALITCPCPLPSSPGCPPVCSGSGIWPETGSLWEQAGPPSEHSAGLLAARHDWLSRRLEGPWSLQEEEMEGVIKSEELLNSWYDENMQIINSELNAPIWAPGKCSVYFKYFLNAL